MQVSPYVELDPNNLGLSLPVDSSTTKDDHFNLITEDEPRELLDVIPFQVLHFLHAP